MEKLAEQHQKCDCCDKLVQLEEAVKREKAANDIKVKDYQSIDREIGELFQELEENNISPEKLMEVFCKTFEDVLKVRSRRFVNHGRRILQYLERIKLQKEEVSTQHSLFSSPHKEERPSQTQPKQESKQQRRRQPQPSELSLSINNQEEREREREEGNNLNELIELANCLANINLSSNNQAQEVSNAQPVQPVNINPIIPEVPPNELSLPIRWQNNQNFQIDGRTICSKFNSWHKLCSADSLPKTGKYTLKFKVKTNRTVSFGVVVERKKGGRFIDDRNAGSISYISFDNGGGMIKQNGEIRQNSQTVHLSAGTTLQITLDFITNDITFKNSRASHEKISLSPEFLKQNLYLFLHTKDAGTIIELL